MKQLKRIERDETQEPVNFVKKETTNKFYAHKQHTESKKNNSFGMQVKDGQQCRYCGGRHERVKKKCPAFGKTCTRCGKFNHFQSVCQKKHTVRHVQKELCMDDETVYCIEIVGAVEHKRGKKIFVPLCFNDDSGETKVLCQLDTGAT